VTEILRNDVLEGIAVCVAGDGGVAASRCAALGARVSRLDADWADEEALAAEVAALGPIDVLVCDAGPAFAREGAGLAGLRAAVDGTWNAVRAVVSARWTTESGDGGKVVLVAPPAGAGVHAGAAGAALENAARTLSVEWARFGVRTVALRPEGDAGAQVAELVAFLASPGGDYFSGCALQLRAV
jgi:NAD(P)-dependent dehydrogenase (short-subunit alcohol dehydrogenase family)